MHEGLRSGLEEQLKPFEDVAAKYGGKVKLNPLKADIERGQHDKAQNDGVEKYNFEHIIRVRNEAMWERFLITDKPVVMLAGGDHVPQCKRLFPYYEMHAKNYADSVKCIFFDTQKFRRIADHLRINIVPWAFLLYGGNAVEQLPGGGAQGDPREIK